MNEWLFSSDTISPIMWLFYILCYAVVVTETGFVSLPRIRS